MVDDQKNRGGICDQDLLIAVGRVCGQQFRQGIQKTNVFRLEALGTGCHSKGMDRIFFSFAGAPVMKMS